MTDNHRPGESSEPAARQPTRPSLTGQQPARAESGESVSILSAVNQPRKAEASPVPKGVASALPWIGVLALIAIGIIFWLELRDGQGAAPAAVAVTAPSPPRIAPPPAAEPAIVAEPTPQVATIETEHVAPAASETAKPATTAPAPAGSAVAIQPSPETGKPPPKVEVAKPVVASAAPEAARQRSPFATMETPAAPRKPASKPAPSGNADIDLLQALLSATPSRPATSSAAPAAAPKVVKPKPAEPAVKEVSRDVVERDPVISTADLLKRCDKLGVLEAVLCKTRICSGLWGRDAACPVSSDPAYKKS